MEKNNTLEYLLEALDDALYIYGRCLVEDIDKAELSEDLGRWLELTRDIMDKIEEHI